MMNKVFSKCILRDLRDNFPRWLALFFMIVMGMYIVISVVGAAETIITESRRTASKNRVEDGEFTTFFPLMKEQEEVLAETGVKLERKFSVDISMGDGSTLRLMKQRETVNLIEIDKGRLAKEMGKSFLRNATVRNTDIRSVMAFT